MSRLAVVLILVFLTAGCASSGGGGEISLRPPPPAERIMVQLSAQSSVASLARIPGVDGEVNIQPLPPKSFVPLPKPVRLPKSSPMLRRPMKRGTPNPVVSVDPPESFVPLPEPVRVPKSRASIISHCENVRGFDDTAGVTLCNRARIPGLIPLYNLVSADIDRKIANKETIEKIGVVIDVGDHGRAVFRTAEIATRKELLQYFDAPGSFQIAQKFRTEVAAGSIVNISFGGIFVTSALSSVRSRISPQDVRMSRSLLLLPTGNFEGPEPAQSRQALREIHALPDVNNAGSVLLVAGLTQNKAFPLTDGNGFHKGYRAVPTDGIPFLQYIRTQTVAEARRITV